MGFCKEHKALAGSENVNCPQCEFYPFVHNHFFTAKMMGVAEFRTEWLYHAEKMRHHNVRLHGFGVVCGLRLKQHPSPECQKRYVIVEPGSALDCCGHEILVPQEEIVDVGGRPEVKKIAQDNLLHTLQVCVRWRECPTEEVPVLYDECGCDDTKCAPNRILESFDFDVMVDPPLSGADLLNGAPRGAFVSSAVHSARGFTRAAGSGKLAVIDPTNAKRLLVLDPPHRALLTVTLEADARATALSANGVHVFVITAPKGGGNNPCEVHVFALADGTEVKPTSATSVRTVPGTTGTSTILAAATNDTNLRLLVLDADKGKLYTWKSKTPEVIDDVADTSSILLPTKLTSLVSTLDGQRAYAIDSATSKVKSIDLTGGSPVGDITITGLPPASKPNSLALVTFGANNWLAVTSDGEKHIYLVDPGAGAGMIKDTIDVSHAPVYLGADGDWLYVFEEEGGHAYVQSANVRPINGGNKALLTAARRAGPDVPELILLYPDGQAGLSGACALADSDCADHLWKQLEGCPACDLPDCVVLATVSNYRPDMRILDPAGKEEANPPTAADDVGQSKARIDNRVGRRLLASTATLQAWLQCLQLKGGVPGPAGPAGPGGPPGPSVKGDRGEPGPGLEKDLVRIEEIGWKHNDITSSLTNVTLIQSPKDFKGLYVRFTRPVSALDRGSGSLLPNAMEIFLPDKPVSLEKEPDKIRTLLLKTRDNTACFCCAIGILIPCEQPDPAKNELKESSDPSSTIWAFVLSDNAKSMANKNMYLRIKVRGDFFIDEKKRAVDAEFPRAVLPSGDRPSGSKLGIQGGLFESWTWLVQG